MAEAREWTLMRGVQAPVVFTGELLYHHDGVGGISLWQSLASRGRWHALSVFRSREGRLVVYLCYRTRMAGEIDNREVFMVDRVDELPALFSQYQQVAFPVIASRMPLDALRRQREVMDLLARFQAQVAKLLSALPGGAQGLP